MLVGEFERRPTDQHSGSDQRPGIAEHAEVVTAGRENGGTGGKGETADERHRQGARQPEDQARRRGGDPGGEQRIDSQNHHRLAGSGLDDPCLIGGNDPVGNQAFGIGNSEHRLPSVLDLPGGHHARKLDVDQA